MVISYFFCLVGLLQRPREPAVNGRRKFLVVCALRRFVMRNQRVKTAVKSMKTSACTMPTSSSMK